jgi:hypothetical protein
MNGFFPGQRVLCIDGKFHPSVWDWVNEVPLEGEVYTVAWIREGGRNKVTGKIGPALALEEVCGSLPGVRSEVCWIVERFAPLDIKETSTASRKKKGRLKKKKTATKPRRLEPVPA